MQELYDVERSFHCYPRRKLEKVQIAQSNLCYGTHLTKAPKYEQEHEHAHSLSVLMRLSRYIYIFLQFHFIVKEADTDTTVVPRGVVAAMKALREQKETSQGGDFLLMWCSQCCDLS